MSELENQVDEIEQDEIEEVNEVEPQDDEVSELAPEQEAEPEQNEEEAHKVNQDKINQVINKKHREAKEWQEKYEALAKQQQQNAQPDAPEIPPMPDPFDDDYAEKVKQRDEALRKRSVYEAEQQLRQQIAQQQAQQAQQQQIAQMKEATESYVKKAKEYGITPEQLQEYGTTAAQYVSDDLALAIVQDPDGALLTKYLASNPMEAMQLQSMNPYQVVMHIERNIRPKAQALKPKKTSAPQPTTKVDASGANVKTESPLLKGARFE